jgi:hypothetical protein
MHILLVLIEEKIFYYFSEIIIIIIIQVYRLSQVIVFSVSTGNAGVFVEAKFIEALGPQCVFINTGPLVR